MWARHMQLSLGLWLVASPFVFRHPAEARVLWASDLASGALLTTLALLSHWRPLRKLHSAELLVAAWLLAFGRLHVLAREHAAAQNLIVVGLLVTMLALVPSDASRPPVPWRSRE